MVWGIGRGMGSPAISSRATWSVTGGLSHLHRTQHCAQPQPATPCRRLTAPVSYAIYDCPLPACLLAPWQVADMKNSVKDRANAQSSCAACFIYEHLHPSFEGGWLHVDLAGPSFIDDRGTGFGVGLTLALLGVEGFKAVDEGSGE